MNYQTMMESIADWLVAANSNGNLMFTPNGVQCQALSLTTSSGNSHQNSTLQNGSHPEGRLLSDAKVPGDELRKQICDDITHSTFFHQNGIYPYKKRGGRLLGWFSSPFRYHYTTINVRSTYLNEKQQYLDAIDSTFVCLARDGKKGNQKKHFYISGVYNLGCESDYICPGRFIFFKRMPRHPHAMVYAVAELPAIAFHSPDHAVEGLYLRRRTNLMGQFDMDGEKALCKMDPSVKERICQAVFKSDDFAHKGSFSDSDFVGLCLRKSVSFQTEYGRAESEFSGQEFNEWLLNCHFINADAESPFTYFLSHAYTSNQMFVYLVHVDTGAAFLDHLVSNVRICWSPSNSPDDSN